jgi:hypothetical protein
MRFVAWPHAHTKVLERWLATSENREGMATELVWRQSHLADGIEAKGASGDLYIVMPFPGPKSSPGIYLASYRSSFSEEPHYFERFPLTPNGLAIAKAACQAREARRDVPRTT